MRFHLPHAECAARAEVALLVPGDAGLIPPCAECAARAAAALVTAQEDWLRVVRSASAAVGGGPW